MTGRLGPNFPIIPEISLASPLRAGLQAVRWLSLYKSTVPSAELVDEARPRKSTRYGVAQMALTTEQKKAVLKKFAKGSNDTGSPEVQVALLTERINQLGGHFQAHTKDHHSRRGLLRLVGQRRRMLDYLERKNVDSYKKLINELGIRK